MAVHQLHDIDGQDCHIVKGISEDVVGQNFRLFVLFVTQAHRVRHMSPEVPNGKQSSRHEEQHCEKNGHCGNVAETR